MPEVWNESGDKFVRNKTDDPLEEIRDQLAFMKRLRGGRLRHIRHKLQHPQEFLPEVWNESGDKFVRNKTDDHGDG
jgi:hypothetical protein